MQSRRSFLAGLLAVPGTVLAGEYPWPALPTTYQWPAVAGDPRPVMKFYYSAGCAPCRMAKIALTAQVRKDLPFQLVEIDTAKSREWGGAVPAFTWGEGASRKAVVGWYGVNALIAAWSKNQVAEVRPQYPTRSSNWSGPDGRHQLGSVQQAIAHLTGDWPHRGHFERSVLQNLNLDQLRALHSDDHEGRVQWNLLRG